MANKNRGPAYVCPECKKICLGGRGFSSHLRAHPHLNIKSGKEFAKYIKKDYVIPPKKEKKGVKKKAASPPPREAKQQQKVASLNFCPNCGIHIHALNIALDIVTRTPLKLS